jgi:hypothetical protein
MVKQRADPKQHRWLSHLRLQPASAAEESTGVSKQQNGACPPGVSLQEEEGPHLGTGSHAPCSNAYEKTAINLRMQHNSHQYRCLSTCRNAPSSPSQNLDGSSTRRGRRVQARSPMAYRVGGRQVPRNFRTQRYIVHASTGFAPFAHEIRIINVNKCWSARGPRLM